MLKLDHRVQKYLKTFFDIKDRSIILEKACDAALKFSQLVDQRTSIVQRLKTLEVYDIRTNHTYKTQAQYFIKNKLNHSAMAAPRDEDLKSPTNFKKFLKNVKDNNKGMTLVVHEAVDDGDNSYISEVKALEVSVVGGKRVNTRLDESFKTPSPSNRTVHTFTNLGHDTIISPINQKNDKKISFCLLPIIEQ